MELATVLTEWINAAVVTQRLIEAKIAGEELPMRRSTLRVFGPMTINFAKSNADGPLLRELREEVKEQLSPKVSLAKNLTLRQRRAAGRRTLRNVMDVYCPELLSDFEEAVERRAEWVESNRAALKVVLDSDSPSEDLLQSWRRESAATRRALTDARAQLVAFIKETFPVQATSG